MRACVCVRACIPNPKAAHRWEAKQLTVIQVEHVHVLVLVPYVKAGDHFGEAGYRVCCIAP